MTDKWHGGKGSKARPIENRKKFDDNWDRIFGKKKNNFDDDKDLKFTAAEDYMKESGAKDETR